MREPAPFTNKKFTRPNTLISRSNHNVVSALTLVALITVWSYWNEMKDEKMSMTRPMK